MNLYRTTFVVTVFTLLEHLLGFLYRIILSRTLGSEGLGVYQVALTVFAVFLTISSSGLPITLSRIISKHRAHGYRTGEQKATTAAMLIALSFSVPITVLLYLFRTPFSRIFSDPRCADVFYILLFGLSFTALYSIIRGSFWGNKRFFAYSLIELVEELVMIGAGVLLLVVVRGGIADVNKAAVALLAAYLTSFAVAAVYFFARGGRLRSPKGEIKPLLKASLPITAMRASSSLLSSFISVLFPLCMTSVGYTAAKAMSEYGVVYGMVMPVVAVPCSLIGPIALVLVPELSERFYKRETKQLGELVEKALNVALLIAGMLIPLFFAVGKDVGIFLFSNAESGEMIAACAPVLLPMSVSMISTSMLNSLGCERQTLLIFLGGSCAMLLCVWLLPPVLGSGALLVGTAVDHTITAACSLALLRKKTGKLRSGRYFLRLMLVIAPVTLFGVGLHALLVRYMSYVPAAVCVMLCVAVAEVVLLSVFKLCDFRALIKKFMPRRKRRAA